VVGAGTVSMAAVAAASLGAAGDPLAEPYLGAPWTSITAVFWVTVAVVALFGGRGWRHVRTAAWLGRLPRRIGALPTEVRPSYERPTGFKVARLVADPVTGEASFLGLTLGGLYAHDDTATCEVLAGTLPPPRRWGRRAPPAPHDAPDLTCTCGFYALHRREDATSLLATRPPISRMFGPVLLEVDLAGTVVEFDRGYRASQQRVLGVQVPRWCVPCARLGRAREARRVAGLGGAALEEACRSDLPQHPPLYRLAMVVHHADVVRRLAGRAALRPVCDDHTPVTAGARASDPVVLELADLAAGLGTEVRWLDDDAFDVGRFVEAVSWPPPPRGSLAV
jgi:hypothetical protein